MCEGTGDSLYSTPQGLVTTVALAAGKLRGFQRPGTGSEESYLLFPATYVWETEKPPRHECGSCLHRDLSSSGVCPFPSSHPSICVEIGRKEWPLPSHWPPPQEVMSWKISCLLCEVGYFWSGVMGSSISGKTVSVLGQLVSDNLCPTHRPLSLGGTAYSLWRRRPLLALPQMSSFSLINDLGNDLDIPGQRVKVLSCIHAACLLAIN